MTDALTIRDAKPREAMELSALAMRSKSYWGYSKEFMEACRAELTVSPEDIGSDDFRYVVAEHELKLLGYYALEKCSEQEYELEALFVEPSSIGTGIGKSLIAHAKTMVIASGGKTLTIQGDPNAESFYRAVGGRKVGMRESASIPGRNLPLFVIELENENVA